MNLVVLKVTTTGSDGAALGTAESELAIIGRIIAVVLDYHASAPGGTTDVTLYQTDTPINLILSYADSATDICLHPRKQSCEVDGTALTYDGTYKVTEPFVVYGKLTLAVAESNALTDCVAAWIYYE